MLVVLCGKPSDSRVRPANILNRTMEYIVVNATHDWRNQLSRCSNLLTLPCVRTAGLVARTAANFIRVCFLQGVSNALQRERGRGRESVYKSVFLPSGVQNLFPSSCGNAASGLSRQLVFWAERWASARMPSSHCLLPLFAAGCAQSHACCSSTSERAWYASEQAFSILGGALSVC